MCVVLRSSLGIWWICIMYTRLTAMDFQVIDWVCAQAGPRLTCLYSHIWWVWKDPARFPGVYCSKPYIACTGVTPHVGFFVCFSGNTNKPTWNSMITWCFCCDHRHLISYSYFWVETKQHADDQVHFLMLLVLMNKTLLFFMAQSSAVSILLVSCVTSILISASIIPISIFRFWLDDFRFSDLNISIIPI